MARYDKYDPVSGGFRAQLAVAIPAADAGKVQGVGLDANGRVVVGQGNTGIVGVLVVDDAKAIGDVVDVMTDGEIVDVAGLTAGTGQYADFASGAVTQINTDAHIGHTVAASRLVVRVAR